MDYRDYVALVLNVPRIRLQWAWAHMAGQGACSTSRLGREWADAVARDAAEVDEYHFEVNRVRDIARARARAKGGGR